MSKWWATLTPPASKTPRRLGLAWLGARADESAKIGFAEIGPSQHGFRNSGSPKVWAFKDWTFKVWRRKGEVAPLKRA